jgi:hypothetical protein
MNLSGGTGTTVLIVVFVVGLFLGGFVQRRWDDHRQLIGWTIWKWIRRLAFLFAIVGVLTVIYLVAKKYSGTA